jgi:hypothetical protein
MRTASSLLPRRVSLAESHVAAPVAAAPSSQTTRSPSSRDGASRSRLPLPRAVPPAARRRDAAPVPAPAQLTTVRGRGSGACCCCCRRRAPLTSDRHGAGAQPPHVGARIPSSHRAAPRRHGSGRTVRGEVVKASLQTLTVARRRRRHCSSCRAVRGDASKETAMATVSSSHRALCPQPACSLTGMEAGAERGYRLHDRHRHRHGVAARRGDDRTGLIASSPAQETASANVRCFFWINICRENLKPR